MRDGRQPAYVKNSPTELDADMTPADLVEVLRGLDFGQRHTKKSRLEIDEGVRDYLVAVLTRARGRSGS